MGLDWHIRCNGKDLDDNRDEHRCNGMILDPYLDGCSAHMISDLGLNPYYPLWPAEMTMAAGFIPKKTEIDAEDMQIIAQLISKRAECAEHLRIAAWLWTWAEKDEEAQRITLHMSY